MNGRAGAGLAPARTLAWSLLREVLDRDGRVTVPVSGGSMRPFLPGPRRLTLERAASRSLRIGDVVGYEVGGRFFAHRIVARPDEGFRVRGDAGIGPDHVVAAGQVWGRVRTVWSGWLGAVAHAVARRGMMLGRALKHVPRRGDLQVAR